MLFLIIQKLQKPKENTYHLQKCREGKEEIVKIARQLKLENSSLKMELESIYLADEDDTALVQKDIIQKFIVEKDSSVRKILKEIEELDTNLVFPITRLQLGSRARNALLRDDIDIVGEFCLYPNHNVESIRDLGKKSIEEIKEAIYSTGIESVKDNHLQEAQNLISKYRDEKELLKEYEQRLFLINHRLKTNKNKDK